MMIARLSTLVMALALAGCVFPTSEMVELAGPAPDGAKQLFFGTGFFIDDHGDLVTANHVIQDCRSVSISSGRLAPQPATLIMGGDEQTDIALLHVDAQYPAFYSLGRAWGGLTSPPNVGKYPISIIGYQGGGFFGQGVIVEHRTVGRLDPMNYRPTNASRDAGRYIVYSETGPGFSGSPLLDVSSRVIGVVVSGIVNEDRDTAAAMPIVTTAVKSEDILEMIERSKLNISPALDRNVGQDLTDGSALVTVYCYM
jgi:S1-C subfamily serine protease